MSPRLAYVLRPMCRLVEPDQLVTHKDGKAIEQNKVRTVLLRIFKKAELKPIKMHGLRHTYASLLLSKGVSQYYVQTQLGHSSISITCDIYGNWIRNDDNRHVDLLDSPQQICTLSATSEKQKPQHLDIAANNS